MNSKISKLKELLITNLNLTDKALFKRNNKISTKDVFYYTSQLIKNKNTSSTIVTSKMYNKKICNVTASSFIKKRNQIPFTYFNDISNKLLEYHYSISNNRIFNKYRILAVDGTHSQLSKNLLAENYKLTKNKTFVNALISGLYDISNNTIVDLHLSNTNSERKQYVEQFKYLNKNDIVIHDRGYYSAKLLYELYIKEIYPIFRMKINDSNVEDLLKSDENDKIYIINNENTNFIDIKLRLIKYIVNNKKYILGTTLLDTEFTIEKLAKLYHDRWDIETYFRTIKYDISFKNFHSKKENL